MLCARWIFPPQFGNDYALTGQKARDQAKRHVVGDGVQGVPITKSD